MRTALLLLLTLTASASEPPALTTQQGSVVEVGYWASIDEYPGASAMFCAYRIDGSEWRGASALLHNSPRNLKLPGTSVVLTEHVSLESWDWPWSADRGPDVREVRWLE